MGQQHHEAGLLGKGRRAEMRRLLIGLLVVMGCIPILRAQEYSGVTGMIHVPTAEMATEGEARIGFFFLNQEFLPDTYQYEGEKFNTTNHFWPSPPSLG